MNKMIPAMMLFLATGATARSASAAVYLDSVASYKTAPPANQLSLQALPLLVGAVGVDYERRLGPNASIVFGPKAVLFDGIDLEGGRVNGVGGKAVGGELGLRFYPTGGALNGFYINPHAAYYHAFAESGADNISLRPAGEAISGGARLGYQWVIGDGAVISLAAGAIYDQMWTHTYNGRGLRADAERSGLRPDILFGTGFAF